MARVLVLNTGSSTLKWSVIELPGETPAASGNDPLDSDAPNIEGIVARAGRVDAIAHRVVHGGARFVRTQRIGPEVLRDLEKLRPLAPLHVPRSLAAMEAASRALPSTPQFACFDTAFHAGLPAHAATYAIPRAWTERFGIRRFGFHGLSVAYAVRRARERWGPQLGRMVVMHLGSGASMTAVEGEQSLDTTMGFTPLEGLVMATRSGSIDPGILLHLQRERGMDAVELDRGLDRESGLLGVSGVSSDLRKVLEAAEAGDASAKLAYAIFLHGLRRGLAQMLASLGAPDALIFTGGIGEHGARTREDLLRSFGWMGLSLDAQKNAQARPDAEITGAGSRAKVLVIEAREDLTMAREVSALLG